MTGPRRRLALVVLVGLLPWSVVLSPGATTLFHPFGFLNLAPPRNFVNIYDYLFVYTRGLPEFILSLPLGGLVYLVAVGSAALGLIGLEDQRLTAGLLVVAGLSQLSFAWGFGRRAGYLAVPVVTITTLVLVWWVYWPMVRESLGPSGE